MQTDRRDFLQRMGLGLAALGALPASIAKAMAIPAHNASGSIMDVEHVVIYMQENRSFDHYFGAFCVVRGFGYQRPLRLHGGAAVLRQPSSDHPDGHVMPFHGDARTTNAYAVDGADQSHQENTTIANGGRYDPSGHSGELHK